MFLLLLSFESTARVLKFKSINFRAALSLCLEKSNEWDIKKYKCQDWQKHCEKSHSGEGGSQHLGSNLSWSNSTNDFKWMLIKWKILCELWSNWGKFTNFCSRYKREYIHARKFRNTKKDKEREKLPMDNHFYFVYSFQILHSYYIYKLELCPVLNFVYY